LKKFKTKLRYYFIKWHDKTKKNIIINKLMEIYNENNTRSEVIKYEFDRDKNNIFKDSTNSLINNIEIIDTKYNENEKNGKLSIENYHIKNYIASVNTRKAEQLNDKTKNILNEIHEKNKLIKKKKKLIKVVKIVE